MNKAEMNCTQIKPDIWYLFIALFGSIYMQFDIKENLVHQVYLIEQLSHCQLHFVLTFHVV